jgi:hypothetical protein
MEEQLIVIRYIYIYCVHEKVKNMQMLVDWHELSGLCYNFACGQVNLEDVMSLT